MASYIVLRGRPRHAGSRATGARPAVLRSDEGRAAVGVPDDERIIGLLHLGPPRQEKEPPARLGTSDFVTWLP